MGIPCCLRQNHKFDVAKLLFFKESYVTFLKTLKVAIFCKKPLVELFQFAISLHLLVAKINSY